MNSMDWSGIIWIVLIAAAYYVFKYALPTYATKIVESYFNERLEKHKYELNLETEKHKHALNLLTEAAKFSYQRLISDYNLFISKRHEIYPELFALIVKAENQVSFCDDIKSLALIDCGREDIESIITQLNTTSENGKEILRLWDADDKDGVKKKIASIQKFNSIKSAQQSLISFKRKFLESRLYLSDEVESLCEEIIGVLDFLMTLKNPMYANLYFFFGKLNANYVDPEEVDAKKKEFMNKIKVQMKEELSKAVD